MKANIILRQHGVSVKLSAKQRWKSKKAEQKQHDEGQDKEPTSQHESLFCSIFLPLIESDHSLIISLLKGVLHLSLLGQSSPKECVWEKNL